MGVLITPVSGNSTTVDVETGERTRTIKLQATCTLNQFNQWPSQIEVEGAVNGFYPLYSLVPFFADASGYNDVWSVLHDWTITQSSDKGESQFWDITLNYRTWSNQNRLVQPVFQTPAVS